MFFGEYIHDKSYITVKYFLFACTQRRAYMALGI